MLFFRYNWYDGMVNNESTLKDKIKPSPKGGQYVVLNNSTFGNYPVSTIP